MGRVVIAVVGSKKSGKTTTIELLIRELTKRGHEVAVVKHISEPNFTIDREGKDTWRFARSGARVVVSVSADEIAEIEKLNTRNISLMEILRKVSKNEIVFLEGFRKLVAENRCISKIVVVKSRREALEAVKNFHPILALTGPYSTDRLDIGPPYVDAVREPARLASMIESIMHDSK